MERSKEEHREEEKRTGSNRMRQINRDELKEDEKAATATGHGNTQT